MNSSRLNVELMWCYLVFGTMSVYETVSATLSNSEMTCKLSLHFLFCKHGSPEVCIFHAAFHDGKAGSKGRVLAYPDDCCPKLLQIAQQVVADPLKSVILMLGFGFVGALQGFWLGICLQC